MSSICDSAAKKGIEIENNGIGMSEDIIHVNNEDRFHNSGYKWALKAYHKSVHRAILLLLEKITTDSPLFIGGSRMRTRGDLDLTVKINLAVSAGDLIQVVKIQAL